jgi:hypothetical protein
MLAPHGQGGVGGRLSGYWASPATRLTKVIAICPGRPPSSIIDGRIPVVHPLQRAVGPAYGIGLAGNNASNPINRHQPAMLGSRR